MKLFFALAFLLLMILQAAGAAKTYKVYDIETLAHLLEGRAQPGDIIEIQPGTYYLDRPRIFVTSSGTPEAPIIITGKVENGIRPTICASRTHVWNGIFYFPEETHDVVVQDLELRNAQGDGRGFEETFSRNAAGVFLQGTNLTVRNCQVHSSENGLFATATADFILVENCDIGYNGRLEHQRSDGRQLNPHRTHNFYFTAQRQIIKNSYIHNSLDAVNFKSRGRNTIFAYNWVEEDMYSSMGTESHNQENTLWLGNVAVKRSYIGPDISHAQRSLLRVGDGTGVAHGKVVALNNTFITYFPRDYYIFTFRTSTTDMIFMNNVFAGPGENFLSHNGHGTITGKNNWITTIAGDVPNSFENTVRGEDPGFASRPGFDFRLLPGSPLVNEGVSQEEYMEAIRLVTQYSRGDGGAKPSPIYLEALEEIERPHPVHEPARKAPGFVPRSVQGRIDLGAYEFEGIKQ